MKKLDYNSKESIKNFKIFILNRSNEDKRKNKEFREKYKEKFDQELKREIESLRDSFKTKLYEIKRKDDILTPKEIERQLKISRKTFDRWANDGLRTMQRSPGSSIRVKREELEIYLNEKGYDGLF
ncbi:helix-turn-helix domain-containing protein [Gramella lutea]|uniref:Helix-turn-helix domain-containing protein n=1 Tax=Christiangramia lutea TaxID=1607951 RepID=A0A9X2A7Q5_9FLAO|nr:helix-turn-helix domain-containing protein [Christiangramia lutea]MCH4821679.1 helix-turn-helix domain-containing protein [Christiangramia lutea]